MSSYTAFDATKPAGTQTGTQFATSANANDVALWYAVVGGGQVPSFVMSQTIGTGTAEQPQYWYWTDSAQIVRATNTWGSSGGASGNLTQIVWDVSQDTGATYANVCTQAFTYDANGNLTATSGAGGFASFLGYLVGKVKTLLTNFNAHTAALGSAVHGLGTISTQAATAVNIDGGTIDGTVIGSVTRALGTFLQSRGTKVNPTFGTTTTLDWSQGDAFAFTATGSGAATLAFSNLPVSGIGGWITVSITNGGLRTWTWPTGTKWVGGAAPTLSSAGRDRLNFYTDDAGTTIDGFVGKGMA